MRKVLLLVVVIATTYLMASEGATLTRGCVACHGADFTKAPLGRKHHIIKDSKARIVSMMKYYQNPKEEDEMVMKGQVKNLTDTQISTVADYIVGSK